MQVVVAFQDESLEFEVPDEARLVAAWNGPPAIDRSRLGDAISRRPR